MYDLIIVGGGPAGLTAAIYAIRRRLNVLLVSQDLGGKTNYHMTLPGMEMHQVIRGVEVVEKFRREVEYLDFARRQAAVQKIDKRDNHFVVTTTGQVELVAKSIIFATGSSVQRLNVPGEQDFLGRGLSYSALSYAPLFAGKRAVVIGDGELALRAAAELAHVATAVRLIAPGPGALDTPLGKQLRTGSFNVVILEAHKVKAIRGNGFAERVIVETPEGQEIELETDGVFIELGLVPNSNPVKDLVELDVYGRVVVDNRNRTDCAGLFAAGDVTNAYAEQVLIAVGEGAKAALSAYEYLLARL
jgi:alkyl hydroperoxide reductase subunit F